MCTSIPLDVAGGSVDNVAAEQPGMSTDFTILAKGSRAWPDPFISRPQNKRSNQLAMRN